jgi:spermidine synthase
VAAGQTLSAYPVSGDWSAVRREYWWRAFEGLALPPRPRVLLVGLGGGTQVHVLRQLAPPRAVTAIERDTLIVRVAREWFGLRAVRRLQVIRGEAQVVIPRLIASRRIFDLVVEDAAYADADGRSAALLRGKLFRLVSPGGALVVNRHFRRPARLLAAEMARFFREVSVRRIRRDGENVVVRGIGRHADVPKVG